VALGHGFVLVRLSCHVSAIPPKVPPHSLLAHLCHMIVSIDSIVYAYLSIYRRDNSGSFNFFYIRIVHNF